MALGIVLLSGSTRGLFLMSEVLMYRDGPGKVSGTMRRACAVLALFSNTGVPRS